MASKDNNFVKALKELTGFDEETSELVEERKEKVAEREFRVEKPRSIVPPTIVPPAAPVSSVSKHVREQQTKSKATKITANMVVIGNIRGDNRIDIMGRVRGDVQTNDDLVVEGIAEGDLRGKNMLLKGSALKGNILASGDVAVEAGTVVIGNVQAKNIKLDGKIKGNLFVTEMTQFTENALLLGDVETMGIAASVGAKIRGSIITKQLDDNSDDIDFDMEV